MNANELLTQAENAHREGDLDTAEKFYRIVIQQEQQIDALFGLATLFHQKKHYDEANELFSRALHEEPTAFDINFNALLCLVDSGRRKEAMEKFHFVVTIAPNNLSLHEQLAALAMKLNLPSEALELLSASNTLSLPATLNKLQAFIDTEQSSMALALSQSLIDTYPNDPKILSLHAIAQVRMQLHSEAVQTYERLIGTAPDNSLLRIKYADLYLLVHDAKAAREQLDVAIGLGDQSIMRYELECRICRIEDDKAKALVAAGNALNIKPDAEFAWHVIQDIGDEDHKHSCIEKLSELTAAPQEYSYDLQHNLYTLAKAYESIADYGQAFTYFDRANTLQSEQLSRTNKVYSPERVEDEFKRLMNFPYPIRSLEHQRDINCRNFFIVGMPRTGTTLTNRVLSQQDGFESCGESNAIATLFENLLLGRGIDVNDSRTELIDSCEKFQECYRQFNRTRLSHVVDKMPHNFRFVGAILATFPDCRVIQMRREIGDLALSVYSNFFNQQHSYSCSLQNIVHQAFQANKMMDFWANAFPNQVIDVEYERLVSKPKQEFRRLFEFCSLIWNDEYLSFHKQVVASFTFSETQVRKPVNTSKLGFSKHYEEQLKDVYDTYAALSQG